MSETNLTTMRTSTSETERRCAMSYPPTTLRRRETRRTRRSHRSKNGVRRVPDYHKTARKAVDHFVLDCVLLCIASERRGKGIFKGTAISDFHYLDGVDLPQFGTA